MAITKFKLIKVRSADGGAALIREDDFDPMKHELYSDKKAEPKVEVPKEEPKAEKPDPKSKKSSSKKG